MALAVLTHRRGFARSISTLLFSSGLLIGAELHAQERKPDEVIDSTRIIDRPALRTHLGRGPLSYLLAPYDAFLERMSEEHALGFAVLYSPIFQVGGPSGSDNTTLNHDLSIYANWTAFEHPVFGKGRLDLYAYHRADQLLGTDTAYFAENIGSSWALSDADVDGTYTSLSALWWEQLLFDGHLDITIGQLDPTVLFDVNRYVSWDRGSFMATPVSSNPTRIFETAGLGLYVEVLDWDIGYVIATVMDADGDGRYPDFRSLKNGRWAYFLEAGLIPYIPLIGELELGVTLNAVDETSAGPASRALLLSFSQDIGDRYAVFLRYGRNDGERNDVDQMVSAGVVLKGVFDFTSDWIGFAFMWAQPTNPTARDQFGIEAYWRLQLTERIQFTPDVQVIIHPAFRSEADVEAVGGLRLLLSF